MTDINPIILSEEFQNYIVKSGQHPVHEEGYHTIVKFPNDYGASIIFTPYSYGYEEGLFEVAVLQFNGKKSHINYDTPITSDVLGYLTNDDCIDILKKIQKL